MKYVSLFSGIEAASVAWKALGWECVAVSEIDKFPCEVLKTRYPNVPNLGSVTDITKEQLDDLKEKAGSIDLVVGGSPCQSFSVAGKRLGLEDARGNLMFEYCRIVGTLRPKWFIWENVPGALSSNKGQDFNCLLEEMAKFGYVLGWRVLDAQYFGVPQRRRRVFLVGCLGDDTGPFKVLFEREGSDWDLAESGEEGEDDSTQTEDSIGEYGEQRGQPVIYTANAIRTGSSIEHSVCPTLRATHSKLGDNFPSIVVEHDLDSSVVTPLYARSGSSPSSDDFAPELQPKMVIEKVWVMGSSQSNAVMEETNVSSMLTATMGTSGDHVPMIVDTKCFTQNTREEVRLIGGDGKTTGCLSASGGSHQTNYLAEYYEHNQTDARIKGRKDVANTITTRYGTSGGHAPTTVDCSVWRITSWSSNSMKSSNPHSGINEVDTSCTLDTTSPCPSKGQGGIAIVEQQYYENHPQDSRVKGPCEVAKSVTATYGTGGGNIPFIVEQTLHESRKQRCGYDEKTVCPTLESAMGVGGGNIPLIVQQSTTFKERDFGEYRECTIGGNLRASGGTLGGGSESLVVQYDLDKEKTGTLCARDGKGIGQDECVQQKIIVENHHIIQHDMDFDLGGTLTARDHKGISSDDFPVNAQKLVLERHFHSDTIPIDMMSAPRITANGRGYGLGGDPMFTLTTSIVHAVQVDELTPCDLYNTSVDYTGTMASLTTQSNATGSGPRLIESTNPVRVESKVRRLTPIECERLQGFPDNWTQIEWRGKKAEDCPLSPRYKALGNSMAVPVMQWLGLGIMYAEGIDKPTSGLFKVMSR